MCIIIIIFFFCFGNQEEKEYVKVISSQLKKKEKNWKFPPKETSYLKVVKEGTCTRFFWASEKKIKKIENSLQKKHQI